MSSQSRAVSLRISAIAHSTENLRSVEKAIRNICELNSSVEAETNRAKGHHGNQITTLAMKVKNPKTAENCLRNVWGRLGVLDKDTIVSSLASRVDASGTMFLRFDKQEAFKGIIRLNDSDPIKVSISFESFPSKQGWDHNGILKILGEMSPVDDGTR